MSLALFGILLFAAIVLALVFPIYWLVLFDFILVFKQGAWSLGGIRVDITDLSFAGLAIGLLLRARLVPNARPLRIPYLPLWAALTLMLALAYLLAPQNHQYLVDPVRISYQLYRYALKPILIYPLAFLLITHRDRFHHVVVALVLAADLCSVSAIQQGYSGIRAGGPFGGGNALGGVLAVPFLLAILGLLFPRSRKEFLFFACSVPFILRALLFAGSRGAYISIMVGLAFALFFLFQLPEGRAKMTRWAPAAALGLVLMLAFLPYLSERPTLRRLATVSDPSEVSTFQWRWQLRWPHFWQRALENPWIGTGTDVDFNLGLRGNTPHNGYLSLSVKFGFPAAAMFVTFAFLAILNGLRSMRRSTSSQERIHGITIAAAILVLLVHNVVESTLMNAFVAKLFWVLGAVAAMTARGIGGFGDVERETATRTALPATHRALGDAS